MARVFKQKYTYKGQTRETKAWYVEYKTAAGKVVRVPGHKSKKLTDRYAQQLEDDVERERAGLSPNAPVVRRGPVPNVGDSLAEFLATVRAGAEQIELLRSRIDKVMHATRWVYPADLTPEKLEAYLTDRCRRSGTSAQTFNHYLRAVGQFCRWLIKRKALTSNPVEHVEPMNVDADRRRVRRAGDETLLSTLLASVRASRREWLEQKQRDTGEKRKKFGRIRLNLSGEDRAALYLTAAATGLRAGELATLTPEAFDLGENPTVSLTVGLGKNKKGCTLPVHPALREFLVVWMKGREPGTVLWPGYFKGRMRKRWGLMLAHDLADAGLPAEVRGEVFDFHALRVMFITMLARGGVPIQFAQKLARHSTPMLTANVYTKAGVGDLAGQVSKIAWPASFSSSNQDNHTANGKSTTDS